MGSLERLFNVQAILIQHERSLVTVSWKSRTDKIKCCRLNIGNVFGSQDHVVIRFDVLLREIGNSIAN